jgi:HK97 family phage major capsid protein
MTQHRHLPPAPPAPDRIQPLELSQRELEAYSTPRALDAAKSGDWANAVFEREVHRDLGARAGWQLADDPHSFILPTQKLLPRRRDLTAGVTTAGGFLVEAKIVGVLDALRELLRVKQLGAQSMTGLRAAGLYARQGSKATVTWQQNEATQATETADFGFGQIALTPKTLTCHVEISRPLRLQAPDLAEFAVLRELALSMATTADLAAIAGTGASGQPTGIINTAGVGTFNGASITYANVLEAQTDILNANALTTGGEVGFLCRPAVAAVLAQRQGFSTNAPIWSGPLAAGQVLGNTAFSTMNAPASTLIAADWSQLLIAEWGAGLEIRVNPYANFQAGVTSFAASLSIDVALLQASAFSIASGVS